MVNEKKEPKWRILVCDDEEDVRAIIKHTLSLKYEVATAVNGLDLLNKLETVEPDLILLDISMPMMDGYEACASIRKLVKYRHTPIYFLTAETKTDQVKKAYDLGATFYITKPFDPARLLKNLELHFEKTQRKPIPRKHSIEAVHAADEKTPEEAQVPTDRELGTQRRKSLTVQEKLRQSPRVLVIDDDQDVLTLLVTMLKGQYEVLATDDPIEAIELVARAEPDIIIIDIAMPKLDGFHFCRLIKANRRIKYIEMMFISAHTEKSNIDMAKKLTGNPFIRKPFEMWDIQEALATVIGKETFRVRQKTTRYKELFAELEQQRQKAKEKLRKKKEKQFQKKKFEHLKDLFGKSGSKKKEK